MKQQPIHKNLNTSFVDVGALVRYLGSLQFVGSIRIELASYEADIVFTSLRTIEAREYDHIAGRISHGRHALQRILIRSREPHGRIHVYRAVGGQSAGDGGSSIYVDRTIAADARKMVKAADGQKVRGSHFRLISSGRTRENAAMLRALSDLLYIVDKSLMDAKLSFPAAFRLSCESITKDHAFLRNGANTLVYRDGSVFLSAPADAASIASAVFAALRPIFRRLQTDRKYDAIFQQLVRELRQAMNEKRADFHRLGLIKYIDELLAT